MEGKRLDTKLEAEGAEFLVCGHLLIEGTATYKTYTQMPGYDLVATNPERNTSARIQVKSRWATDYDGGFPLKNSGCDFVVLVALNRGYRYSKRKVDEDGKAAPEFYVFTIDVALEGQDPRSGWGKVFKRRIPEVAIFREKWELIRHFLDGPEARTS